MLVESRRCGVCERSSPGWGQGPGASWVPVWLRCLGLCLWLGPALAETAAPSIEDGVAALGKGDYAGALHRFRAAQRAYPEDPLAHFFAGAALNRLGRSREALAALDTAVALYAGHPEYDRHSELDFERGWALLREGRFDDALFALQAYDAAQPGRGQTAEFMGRAHVGLGSYAEAETQFEEALRRDPRLSETVALARVAMAAKRGDIGLAEQTLSELLREERQTPLSRLLAERIPRTAAQRARNFGISLVLGAGHNSNAIGLSEDEPVAGDITNREDHFQRFVASGFQVWRPSVWTVVGSYALQADFYDDIDQVNQVDQIVGLRAYRSLSERLTIGADLRDRYTQVDQGSYLNEVAISPETWWRIDERFVAGFSYSFSHDDYLVPPTSAFLDRDSDIHTISPALVIAMPEWRSSARLNYAHRWISAEGADFDANGDGVTAQIDSSLPGRFTSRVFLSFEHRDYEHPNSLNGFTEARDDDFFYVSVYVQRPLNDLLQVSDRLRLYAQYDYTDRSSNIAFYAYKQHVFSAGIVYAF